MFSNSQMLALGAALTLFGVFFIVLGIDHLEEMKHQNGPPREVSCREVYALNEPGLDARIVLTEFRAGMDGYLCYDEDYGEGFESVYIPAYPSADAEENTPADDHSVIIRLLHIENEDEMFNTLSQPKLVGRVWKRGDTLSRRARNILSGFYPELDFSKSWIVDIGDYTATASRGWGMQAIGIGSLFAGILLLFGGASGVIKHRQIRENDREAERSGVGSPHIDRTF